MMCSWLPPYHPPCTILVDRLCVAPLQGQLLKLHISYFSDIWSEFKALKKGTYQLWICRGNVHVVFTCLYELQFWDSLTLSITGTKFPAQKQWLFLLSICNIKWCGHFNELAVGSVNKDYSCHGYTYNCGHLISKLNSASERLI